MSTSDRKRFEYQQRLAAEAAAAETASSDNTAKTSSKGAGGGGGGSRPKKAAKLDKDLTVCHTLLSELGGHDESWPFLYPVNTKQFPTYKKIIRAPMDISTIRKKLNDGM